MSWLSELARSQPVPHAVLAILLRILVAQMLVLVLFT